MKLRVIRDEPGTGDRNMAEDSRLAHALNRGEIPPTVRLYGWAPPALSIGYHQASEDFDGEKLRARGITIVRRPTGGRAILHWHELTYCAVIPLSAGTPRQLYRRVNEALLGGIRAMGIPAQLGGSESGLKASCGSPPGIACFSRTVTSEIQVGGKKLVGSAQRRVGGVILQHGSFLLGPQHRHLTEFILGNSEGVGLPDLASWTTEAETILGRPVSFGEAAGAIEATFVDHFLASRTFTAAAEYST